MLIQSKYQYKKLQFLTVHNDVVKSIMTSYNLYNQPQLVR